MNAALARFLDHNKHGDNITAPTHGATVATPCRTDDKPVGPQIRDRFMSGRMSHTLQKRPTGVAKNVSSCLRYCERKRGQASVMSCTCCEIAQEFIVQAFASSNCLLEKNEEIMHAIRCYAAACKRERTISGSKLIDCPSDELPSLIFDRYPGHPLAEGSIAQQPISCKLGPT